MWQSIETAPQTGEHILGADFTPGRIGFGMCGGKHQSMMTTVHWWNNPGEEGWYISCSQNDSSEPFPATHWQPLIELAAHAPKQEPSVPDGWKLVPLSPTKEMIDAIHNGWKDAQPDGEYDGEKTTSMYAMHVAAYKAGVKAAPEQLQRLRDLEQEKL